jgi:hypothetical protein
MKIERIVTGIAGIGLLFGSLATYAGNINYFYDENISGPHAGPSPSAGGSSADRNINFYYDENLLGTADSNAFEVYADAAMAPDSKFDVDFYYDQDIWIP